MTASDLRLLLPTALAIAAGTSACVAQDRPFRTAELSDGTQATYTAWLPNDFDTAKNYPVMICPSDMDRSARESWCWRDLDSKFEWIRIGAELELTGQRSPATNKAFLDHLLEEFRVEGGKFHIAGFSANSDMIFQSVIANPEMYHSVTGIPGHPRTNDEEQLRKLSSVRVQLIAGSRDGPWLGASQRAEKRLKELGINVTLEVIRNGGHVLSEVFGNGLFDRLEGLRVQ